MPNTIAAAVIFFDPFQPIVEFLEKNSK